MYKVESDFVYKDYRCVVVFTDMGHRCGYVGIKSGHILYKKDYTDYLDIPNGDERIRIDSYFNVHGGLTYSCGNEKYPIESDLWWFGFDCAHYGDGKDLELVAEYWGDNPQIQERIRIEKEYCNYDSVRSKEYVENECKSLVDQIINLTI